VPPAALEGGFKHFQALLRLDRMIFFGEASLQRAVTEFVRHYNQERNHQSLANKIIRPEFPEFPVESQLRCRKRLGGLLRYYYRQAA
jgi:putative transposase